MTRTKAVWTAVLLGALCGVVWSCQHFARSPRRHELDETGLVTSPSNRSSAYYEQYHEAKLLLAQGKPLEAERIYRELAQKEPHSTDPHVGIAACRMQLSDYATAIKTCETAMRLDPQAIDPLISMGSAHLLLGKPREAAGHYEAALELDDACSDAHWGLAVSYCELGDREEAQVHLGRFKKLAPDSRHIERLERMVGTQ